MKRVSIKDIALKAGVVPSTVSFVLNGKQKEMRISEALTNKIKAIIEETGYYPNNTAVSLRTGKTHLLGLIVEDISNAFFSTLAKSIQEEAHEMGYKIVYCSTENSDTKGNEWIQVLLQHQVDGFFITPCKGMSEEIKKLMAMHVPLVLMDRYFPELDTHYTIVDNRGGVCEGMEHLLRKGYRHIGFVNVDLDQVQIRERENAYTETLEKHGMHGTIKKILRLPYNCSTEQSVEKIKSFIQETLQIDAIFFATSYLGVDGLQSIRQLGLRIPEDLAVICFDDHEVFRFYTPGITVISQPVTQIAKAAVFLLNNQLTKASNTTKMLVNKLQLVERHST